ncbi:MAG: hypothetical protein ACSLEY_03210 [Candidatus Saccharimonadales bacterium]
MANHEQTPNDDSNRRNIDEQLPHSGVGDYERPVTNYDNTSLLEAANQHLKVPSHPIEGFSVAPITPEEQAALEEFRKNKNKQLTKQEKRNKKRKRALAIAAGSTAVSIISGLGTMYSTNKASETPTPGNYGYLNTEVQPSDNTSIEAPVVDTSGIEISPEEAEHFRTIMNYTTENDWEEKDPEWEQWDELTTIYDNSLKPALEAGINNVISATANFAPMETADLSHLTTDPNVASEILNLADQVRKLYVSTYGSNFEDMQFEIMPAFEETHPEDGSVNGTYYGYNPRSISIIVIKMSDDSDPTAGETVDQLKLRLYVSISDDDKLQFKPTES